MSTSSCFLFNRSIDGSSDVMAAPSLAYRQGRILSNITPTNSHPLQATTPTRYRGQHYYRLIKLFFCNSPRKKKANWFRFQGTATTPARKAEERNSSDSDDDEKCP